MNEMVEKMKASIDIQENFLDMIHSKESTYQEIHENNKLISQLHKVIDKLYLELEENCFEFTVFHLLPYAFFKN